MQAREISENDCHPEVRARVRRAVGEGVRDAGPSNVGAARRRGHAPEVDASRSRALASLSSRQHQLHHQRQNK